MNESEKSRAYWNQQASSFDDQPDHGLFDPSVRTAWTKLLQDHIPLHPARILDAGCGTGSLSVLLAGLGHRVTGIDFSPQMIALAKEKSRKAGVEIDFQVMDAADPQLTARSFDVILSRHLLWALPEPARVLLHWTNLVGTGGYLLLIEGFWHTGGGLHQEDLVQKMPPGVSVLTMKNLSENPALWGGAVSDERYLLVARKGPIG